MTSQISNYIVRPQGWQAHYIHAPAKASYDRTWSLALSAIPAGSQSLERPRRNIVIEPEFAGAFSYAKFEFEPYRYSNVALSIAKISNFKFAPKGQIPLNDFYKIKRREACLRSTPRAKFHYCGFRNVGHQNRQNMEFFGY